MFFFFVLFYFFFFFFFFFFFVVVVSFAFFFYANNLLKTKLPRKSRKPYTDCSELCCSHTPSSTILFCTCGTASLSFTLRS